MILESYCDIRRCFDDNETVGPTITIHTNEALQKASRTTINPKTIIKFTKVELGTRLKLCDSQNWNWNLNFVKN
jgi:hypothetical protein